ncbi:hypothetical protein GUJ93_ZPchr0002g23196 [Zizania palustris]|uniref:Uncharacterized protein n=1 Tax=Zizania palustris TaxID=103762 RepID=A0A8J5VBJ5_ZIZPA|nr:hypothetical protein GUJ93_ZPchr0002g23196 [Zizania palustris]
MQFSEDDDDMDESYVGDPSACYRFFFSASTAGGFPSRHWCRPTPDPPVPQPAALSPASSSSQSSPLTAPPIAGHRAARPRPAYCSLSGFLLLFPKLPTAAGRHAACPHPVLPHG